MVGCPNSRFATEKGVEKRWPTTTLFWRRDCRVSGFGGADWRTENAGKRRSARTKGRGPSDGASYARYLVTSIGKFDLKCFASDLSISAILLALNGP